MLDINILRNDPEIIRESLHRRYTCVEVVDEIINIDEEWRQRKYELDNLREERNQLTKAVAMLKISGADATEQIQQTEKNKQDITMKEAEVRGLYDVLKEKLKKVPNIVHNSVPVSNDEANNILINAWGEKRVASLAEELINHVDLVELLLIVDTVRGAKVAGDRGFFLKGDGLRLKQALINFALDFLTEREFEIEETPCFMRKDVMAKCAQLELFDKELYKVTGKKNDKATAEQPPERAPHKVAGKGGDKNGDEKKRDEKYLSATAEQPLSAKHLDDWIHQSELPIRYAGFSTCFRTEAGSHGKDTGGLFRVHQFGKVEQFCITGPNDSWPMFDEMMKNAEDFYQALKLPYRVMSIVSGALNDAAAKKYDLEGWFPASGTYRELVSCSNCTDYLARRLEIRYGHKKSDEKRKQYVHMLNSTLCATERTICCIVENYQREDGVDIPEVLQPYMGGRKFMPFKAKPVVAKTKEFKNA